mmetsp:Transcript_42393/g.91045  ORF Transcript_42393/g.91045 Transcript_42393/m.91045 type:complete len:249 (-) Transcript_42393:2654-3400(-)
MTVARLVLMLMLMMSEAGEGGGGHRRSRPSDRGRGAAESAAARAPLRRHASNDLEELRLHKTLASSSLLEPDNSMSGLVQFRPQVAGFLLQFDHVPNLLLGVGMADELGVAVCEAVEVPFEDGERLPQAAVLNHQHLVFLFEVLEALQELLALLSQLLVLLLRHRGVLCLRLQSIALRLQLMDLLLVLIHLLLKATCAFRQSAQFVFQFGLGVSMKLSLFSQQRDLVFQTLARFLGETLLFFHLCLQL